MKIKILIGVLLFLILVNLVTIGTYLVTLKRGQDDRAFRRVPLPPTPIIEHRPLRKISPALRTRLRENMRMLNQETRELRNTIHDLEAETFLLMQREPVPLERVDSLLQEIANARLEMSRMTTKRLIEARSNFSPEERKMLFDALLSSRPDHPRGSERGMHRDGHRHKSRRRSNPERRPDSLRQ